MKPDVKEERQSPPAAASPDRQPYEPPAIIYSGLITTRAGSPMGIIYDDPLGVDGIDPADLFGDS